MAGVTGTGKSTVAAAVGRSLRWPVFDKDTIKSCLLDVGMADPIAGRVAYQLMLDLVDDQLAAESSCVLDSPATYPWFAQGATALARKYAARRLVVVCECERSVRDRRLRQRAGKRSQPNAPDEVATDPQTRYAHLPENRLVLDTTNSPVDDLAGTVLTHLRDTEEGPSSLGATSVNSGPPTLLLLAGGPGTGKSTLARKVARTLAWTVVDKDTLKSRLLEAGLDEAVADRGAYSLLLELSGDVLAQGLPVVVDSPAGFRWMVDGATRVAQERGARLAVIQCECDRSIRQARLQQRTARRSQMEALIVRPPDPTRYAHLPSERLTVDTSEGVDPVMQQVLAYLGLGP